MRLPGQICQLVAHGTVWDLVWDGWIRARWLGLPVDLGWVDDSWRLRTGQLVAFWWSGTGDFLNGRAHPAEASRGANPDINPWDEPTGPPTYPRIT